jgi:hypothetical protein
MTKLPEDSSSADEKHKTQSGKMVMKFSADEKKLCNLEIEYRSLDSAIDQLHSTEWSYRSYLPTDVLRKALEKHAEKIKKLHEKMVE